MLDLLGWDVGMSAIAGVLLVLGAILLGTIAHFIGEVRTAWEGPIVAVTALIGGYLGSEAFGTFSTWGYEVESLYVLPALIVGVLFGVVADVTVRFLTEGSYVARPRPI